MQWLRLSSLAVEFVAYLLVFGYIGNRLDSKYDWSPWGTLGGLLIGMTLGLWRMVRESEKLNR